MCKADTTQAWLDDETVTYECYDCSCDLTSTNGIDNDSGYYCTSCYGKRFVQCLGCGQETERDEIAELVCGDCRDAQHEACRLAVEDIIEAGQSGALLSVLRASGLLK